MPHPRHRPEMKTPCCGAADPERSPQSRPSLESAGRGRWCGERKRKPYTDRSRKPCSSGSDGLGTTGKNNAFGLRAQRGACILDMRSLCGRASSCLCVVCPLGPAPIRAVQVPPSGGARNNPPRPHLPIHSLVPQKKLSPFLVNQFNQHGRVRSLFKHDRAPTCHADGVGPFHRIPVDTSPTEPQHWSPLSGTSCC